MVKYLVLSDIHFGHNINKTCSIIENLNEFFNIYNKKFKDLNIIFLAGDVFDRLLGNNNKDYLYAVKWLTDLLLYCKDRNITLRILEGTPSHDWKQIEVLNSIIQKLNIDIDFKYIDTLCIEKMVKYNLNILYIPDEWKHKAEETWEDVKKCLLDNAVSKVDIAIMHGQFTYQLPIVLESSHNENNYLSIVKKFINIGHIHTHSVKDRILAQGSFDRLTHGQEEDKGGILVTLGEQDTWEFLVNKKAMVFATYKFDSNATMEDIYKQLNQARKKYPIGSNIRILLDDSPLIGITDDLKKNFLEFNIKIERTSKTKEQQIKLIEQEIEKGFAITKDNIEELLTREISKYNLSKDEYNIYKQILLDYI